MDPQSKLAVETWVERDVAIPGLESIAVQQLYRAMDVLMEAGDALQEEVFFSVAHLLNLEVDLLFFDTTSTYFEVEGEDPEEGDAAYFLRRRGHSKDHRPDLAQIVIGLAVTQEGIPIRCWVWPDNTADVTRIDQVKKDLVGWKLGRVITVLDRGFVSEDNLRTLQRAVAITSPGNACNLANRLWKKLFPVPAATRRLRITWKLKRLSSATGKPESVISWSATLTKKPGTGNSGNGCSKNWNRNCKGSPAWIKRNTARPSAAWSPTPPTAAT
nr:IS1634 family transposase [Moorella glycerini]